MKCERSETLSLWFDGELEGNEELEFAEHLAACAECRAAREDYLRLRAELRAGAPANDPFAQRRALADILHPPDRSLWSRRVAVPVPVLALALLAVVGLGWFGIRSAPGDRTPEPAVRTDFRAPESGVTLARFDRGGRIELRKIARPPLTPNELPGATR